MGSLYVLSITYIPVRTRKFQLSYLGYNTFEANVWQGVVCVPLNDVPHFPKTKAFRVRECWMRLSNSPKGRGSNAVAEVGAANSSPLSLHNSQEA